MKKVSQIDLSVIAGDYTSNRYYLYRYTVEESKLG